MGNIDRKLVIAGLKELKGMKEFCIEEPQGYEGEGIWFHDVLDFCINSLEVDEAYQLAYEKPSLDDFISWAKTEYGVTLIPKPSDEPDTYEKLFDNEKPFDELVADYCKEHGQVIVDKDVWDDIKDYEKPEICEDCIDRDYLIRDLYCKAQGETSINIHWLEGYIKQLPSVLPKAEVHEDCVPRKIVERIIKSPRSQEQMLTILNIIPSVLPKADKPTIIDWNNCHTSEQLNSTATTKNDLGVDAVSRQAINGYIDYILSHGLGKKKSFDFIKKFVANLPPVTPIRPKGHWIDYSDDGYVECPKCGSATNCDDNIADLHFCFSCGAEMGVEE